MPRKNGIPYENRERIIRAEEEDYLVADIGCTMSNQANSCLKAAIKADTISIKAWRTTVRATTKTGYMMTSPKFSTWRPNQGTRSRVTFQLFATLRLLRNDLFPQYVRSCAFEWWGSTWVSKKKWQPARFACFACCHRSTWQGAKHLKIERCVPSF